MLGSIFYHQHTGVLLWEQFDCSFANKFNAAIQYFQRKTTDGPTGSRQRQIFEWWRNYLHKWQSSTRQDSMFEKTKIVDAIRSDKYVEHFVDRSDHKNNRQYNQYLPLGVGNKRSHKWIPPAPHLPMTRLKLPGKAENMFRTIITTERARALNFLGNFVYSRLLVGHCWTLMSWVRGYVHGLGSLYNTALALWWTKSRQLEKLRILM